MTISTPGFLANAYAQSKALGDKSISSDSMFVIDGFEQIRLLTKQFPYPVLSTAGEIEIPGPNGSKSWEQQQLETAKQGQMTFHETTRGDIQMLMEQILAKGGKFNAKVYEGTVERFTRGARIVDCFLKLDDPDRDWENRAQVTTISGTLFYHYFGDKIPGNI